LGNKQILDDTLFTPGPWATQAVRNLATFDMGLGNTGPTGTWDVLFEIFDINDNNVAGQGGPNNPMVADTSTPLKVSGIVYNEMKGASSISEGLMWQLAGCGLFPDTPLGRDAGGDPEHIPDLTYEQFLRFHRELYHPSNGLFFIYGDIPTVEHLRFLAPALNGFERRNVQVATPRQPRWTRPSPPMLPAWVPCWAPQRARRSSNALRARQMWRPTPKRRISPRSHRRRPVRPLPSRLPQRCSSAF
jgi:hypothetical protein